MNVIFNSVRKKLYLTGIERNLDFYADSVVRNELNDLRARDNPKDVVYYMPEFAWQKPEPYMPRPFPIGTFSIVGAELTDIPGLAPYIIRTNASPQVETWSLDKDGCYDKPTGRTGKDTGYLIHYGAGAYTLGCIRIGDQADMYIIYKMILKELYEHDQLRLTVV